jgi:hypothetical protein
MTDQRFARIQENGLVHIVMAYHTLSKHVSISFSGGTNKWFCFLERCFTSFQETKTCYCQTDYKSHMPGGCLPCISNNYKGSYLVVLALKRKFILRNF